MNNKIFFVNFRISFYLFILFSIRNPSLSYVSFNFPYALSLSNGNIFIIHKEGITICDNLLSKIIKNITIFGSSEQIGTEESLSKVTTTKMNNYIISIINDKIYIFNETGDLLYQNNNKILNSSETAEYYTLVSYKIEDNYYFYLIGFVDKELLNFIYYKYDSSTNENYLLSTSKGKNHYTYENTGEIYSFYYIRNKALSCQYMKANNWEKVIVCFFLVYKNDDDYDYYNKDNYFYDYFLTFDYFSIDSSNNLVRHTGFICNHFNFPEISCIKSSVTPDQSKALVGFYFNNGMPSYFIFDINADYIYYLSTYDIFNQHCRNEFHGLKVNYYEDKEEYILTCIDDNGKILIEMLDKDLKNYNYTFKYTDCEEIYGYSILFSIFTQKYYIISDVNCNEKQYPINLLYGDMNYNEEKEEEREEEKKEKEEEEEEDEDEEEKKEEKEEKEKEEDKEEETEEEKEEEDEEEKEKEEKREKEKKEKDEKDKKEEEEEENEEKKEREKEKEKEKEEEKEEKEGEKKKEDQFLDKEEREKIEEENKDEIENKEEISEKETMIKDENECMELEKCQLCNEESVAKNLCIKCDNKKEYYFLYNAIENQNYIECVNNITKPSNFYFSEENNDYEPCYYTCATCNYGGNGIENNCTSCELNYINKPDYPNSTNCVIKCLYFYYYTIFDQYKCTPSAECPKDYNLIIKEKRKCIDNCQNDNLYKYQYNGECLKECPNNTYYDENVYKCKDLDINKCLLTENKLSSNIRNITDEQIEEIAHKYAKEFNYTDNHVSFYKNDIYSITLYKNGECILKLSLEIPEIDFGNCEIKIKNKYKIDENLIIAIITKKFDGISYSSSFSYSFYEPELGKKIPSKEICKDDNIIVVNNILYKLDTNEINLDFILYLTKQNINVFNLTHVFYTDICYHFDSPINKDISLKDRILLCFPNISLCEEDCFIKGVNLTSLKSICECKYNEIINNKIFKNSIIEQSELKEIKELISQTNIGIFSCYKDLFFSKYYVSNPGFFIVFSLIIIQIICIIVFFHKDLYLIRKYIFKITNQYILYLSIHKNANIIAGDNIITNINENKVIKYMEPPRKKNVKINKKEIKDNEVFRKFKKRKPKSNKKKKVSFNLSKNSLDSNDNMNKSINLSNNNNTIGNNNYKYSKKLSFVKLICKRNESINKYLISSKNIINCLNNNPKNDINKIINEYLSTEPEDMDFDDLIKKDKRNFFEFFLDKLKIKQIILNTFFLVEPLKPRAIKIILFIVDIDLYLFINALFINEEYISLVFNIAEEETFFSFFPRSINRFLYTTLVGVILNYIIDCFFIEEKKIKGIFRREKDNEIILKYEISEVINNTKKRYLYFNILSFIILFITLYYIFCFNNVYPHMKIEWIKSSIIIIIIMQILSILICFLESLIRFISYKFKSERIYKISLLLS